MEDKRLFPIFSAQTMQVNILMAIVVAVIMPTPTAAQGGNYCSCVIGVGVAFLIQPTKHNDFCKDSILRLAT